MPKWFSEQEKEFISHRLMEQGEKLFATYGLKKTNVEELARAAGISKGAFYRFYESKEALFMDVVEQVEVRVRRQVLEMVDRPGPSRRARLTAVLKSAFAYFFEIPILRVFSSRDYDLIFQRLPPEKLQAHLASDQAFIEDLLHRCATAGMEIVLPSGQVLGLLYPLVLAALQADELGRQLGVGSLDTHLELISAFCLGEVHLEAQPPAGEPEIHRKEI